MLRLSDQALKSVIFERQNNFYGSCHFSKEKRFLGQLGLLQIVDKNGIDAKFSHISVVKFGAKTSHRVRKSGLNFTLIKRN